MSNVALIGDSHSVAHFKFLQPFLESNGFNVVYYKPQVGWSAQLAELKIAMFVLGSGVCIEFGSDSVCTREQKRIDFGDWRNSTIKRNATLNRMF